MVHLAFFDNFPISLSPPPPPPPPLSPPYNVGSACPRCPPWSNIVWGKGGGPSLGKRTAFIIEQGVIMKTKQIFKVYHILLTRIIDLLRHHLQMRLNCFSPFWALTLLCTCECNAGEFDSTGFGWWDSMINPSTPKSDKFHISPVASPENTATVLVHTQYCIS